MENRLWVSEAKPNMRPMNHSKLGFASSPQPMRADFPKTVAEWEAIIAAASGEETPEAAARLADGVLVESGGPGKKPKDIHDASLARRYTGTLEV
jgi:alkanesulfonate monooxygenase SsuD/methylene tetrahydromethanopterin reductase-like flavin-dependent oxidoreductase (luciferase family)